MYIRLYAYHTQKCLYTYNVCIRLYAHHTQTFVYVCMRIIHKRLIAHVTCFTRYSKFGRVCVSYVPLIFTDSNQRLQGHKIFTRIKHYDRDDDDINDFKRNNLDYQYTRTQNIIACIYIHTHIYIYITRAHAHKIFTQKKQRECRLPTHTHTHTQSISAYAIIYIYIYIYIYI